MINFIWLIPISVSKTLTFIIVILKLFSSFLLLFTASYSWYWDLTLKILSPELLTFDFFSKLWVYFVFGNMTFSSNNIILLIFRLLLFSTIFIFILTLWLFPQSNMTLFSKSHFFSNSGHKTHKIYLWVFRKHKWFQIGIDELSRWNQTTSDVISFCGASEQNLCEVCSVQRVLPCIKDLKVSHYNTLASSVLEICPVYIVHRNTFKCIYVKARYIFMASFFLLFVNKILHA